MSIDNIFNSINGVIEFFIDNVFYGLVRTMFLPENRLLLIGFCILLLISLTLFFVNRFLDSADDIENSMLIMSENSRRKKEFNQRKIERTEKYNNLKSNSFDLKKTGKDNFVVQPSYDIEIAKESEKDIFKEYDRIMKNKMRKRELSNNFDNN